MSVCGGTQELNLLLQVCGQVFTRQTETWWGGHPNGNIAIRREAHCNTARQTAGSVGDLMFLHVDQRKNGINNKTEDTGGGRAQVSLGLDC